jgi:hypothetical protein
MSVSSLSERLVSFFVRAVCPLILVAFFSALMLIVLVIIERGLLTYQDRSLRTGKAQGG